MIPCPSSHLPNKEPAQWVKFLNITQLGSGGGADENLCLLTPDMVTAIIYNLDA